MKITDVEIVQALHWPFVRIHTDEGISGIGEASLQQKERAVRAEVEAYRDFLIGQDATQIEHIWNALHRKTVWSGGPVTMTAISVCPRGLNGGRTSSRMPSRCIHPRCCRRCREARATTTNEWVRPHILFFMLFIYIYYIIYKLYISINWNL